MITDYGSLQTAVANWLQRSHLVVRIPEFIQLAEARLQRKLADVAQEAISTGTLTGGAATLPTDFGSLVAIRDTITAGRLEEVSPSQFEAFDPATSGNPIFFTIIGSQIKVFPVADTTVEIVYRQSLPPLSTSNTTNWLLTRAPDLYLFSTLLQAEFYGWNDERLPLIKTAIDEMLEEMSVDSEHRAYGPAPLTPRIARP